MEQWSGKTALVTGGAAGIGRQVAVDLADKGVTVVAMDRRQDKLKELEREYEGTGKILTFLGDAGVEEDIVRVIEFTKQQAGGIDILINNAAPLPIGTITDIQGLGVSMSALEDSLKTAVYGVVSLTQKAVEDMMARGAKGHILMINSICGHKYMYYGGLAKLGVYGATKKVMTQFVENIRLEISHYKVPIRISSISPGLTDTEMAHAAPLDISKAPILKTKDISDAVLYALSVPQYVNVQEMLVVPTFETL